MSIFVPVTIALARSSGRFAIGPFVSFVFRNKLHSGYSAPNQEAANST